MPPLAIIAHCPPMGGADASLKTLAGYAFLGGVFFLVSALRLGRAAKGA